VDRRRRTELAYGELEKLALYQPGGTVTAAHVDELVIETIPASTWAFLDAVGARAGAQAVRLADRLLTDGTPLPVLVGQLHRRLRDLILLREHIDTGSRPPEIVKAMKMQPFRAKKLSEQARTWSIRGLEAAMADLLALELRSKGISLNGSTLQMSDKIDALVFQTWLERHIDSRGRPASR
jgi:DNA polymerase-3 subunit delta